MQSRLRITGSPRRINFGRGQSTGSNDQRLGGAGKSEASDAWDGVTDGEVFQLSSRLIFLPYSGIKDLASEAALSLV